MRPNLFLWVCLLSGVTSTFALFVTLRQWHPQEAGWHFALVMHKSKADIDTELLLSYDVYIDNDPKSPDVGCMVYDGPYPTPSIVPLKDAPVIMNFPNLAEQQVLDAMNQFGKVRIPGLILEEGESPIFPNCLEFVKETLDILLTHKVIKEEDMEQLGKFTQFYKDNADTVREKTDTGTRYKAGKARELAGKNPQCDESDKRKKLKTETTGKITEVVKTDTADKITEVVKTEAAAKIEAVYDKDKAEL
ncbi:hypothetical protein FA15DRAFT_697156 [Coprinopsis marcescibilis]|uniref:Uncharacterized protein n=1 Tax=Coprinopsis marcescibilis TaxID=230819 RepID=A0A5C3KJ08_COPMA|nr:hypothetical protein FA15DRAFT_697156 [Coprinopsis marcescibilis]